MTTDKTLWVVEVEKVQSVTVLAWAASREDAELAASGALDDCWTGEDLIETVTASPPVMSYGKMISRHDMGRADPVYDEDPDAEEITVADAIAVIESRIDGLPDHLAEIVRRQKESSNGQLPLIQ